MVRGYGCSRGSRHAPTLHEPKGCARGRHSNPARVGRPIPFGGWVGSGPRPRVRVGRRTAQYTYPIWVFTADAVAPLRKMPAEPRARENFRRFSKRLLSDDAPSAQSMKALLLAATTLLYVSAVYSDGYTNSLPSGLRYKVLESGPPHEGEARCTQRRCLMPSPLPHGPAYLLLPLVSTLCLIPALTRTAAVIVPPSFSSAALSACDCKLVLRGARQGLAPRRHDL